MLSTYDFHFLSKYQILEINEMMLNRNLIYFPLHTFLLLFFIIIDNQIVKMYIGMNDAIHFFLTNSFIVL